MIVQPKTLIGGAVVLLLLAILLSAAPRAGSAAVKLPETKMKRSTSGTVQTVQRLGKATFRFRGSKTTRSFKCRIDGRRWHRCRPPARVWTGPGRHRFAVRATGGRGRYDHSPAIRRWKVDRWEPNFKAARKYARRRSGPISFAVDVGWREQEVRGSITAPTASSVKVMLMVAYLNRRGVRDQSLSGYERSLLGAMIRHSDNGAASTVRDIVGKAAIRRLARRAGMKDFQYSPIWGICRTSARDQASFMRNLRSYVPRRHWYFASHQLATITGSQRWGIGQVDHKGWKLYFKGGWGISDGRYGGIVNHQIAQLKRGRWRIGLAILTQGNPYTEYGNTTLRGVAARLLHGLPR